MVEPTERVVTHRTVAKVAQLMGYTSQGLRELIESCRVNGEWVIIGLTRVSKERVAARSINGRLEFSIGSEAFGLTSSEREQERIRREVAEAVVNRIKATRPVVNKRLLKDDHGPEVADDQGSTDSLSSPETMIISPVAPRDPRGLEAAQRRLSGPRNTTSRP